MSTKNEKVIELSIEETNELRLKLGLKPLNITTNKPTPSKDNTESAQI